MQKAMVAMKFLSILRSLETKIGIGASKAVAIEAKLLPLEQAVGVALTLNPATAGIGVTITALCVTIARVQQIFAAAGASKGTGTQKLAAALPDIEQAILSDPLFKGKTISDLPKYNAALVGITGSLADLLDAFNSATPDTGAATLPSTADVAASNAIVAKAQAAAASITPAVTGVSA